MEKYSICDLEKVGRFIGWAVRGQIGIRYDENDKNR